MEFLDGITLKQYIDTQGLLTPAEILDLMAPLMEALDEVHNVGLIHRDISPDNIMLLENGGVKLMDFGAARAYTEFGEKSLSIVLKHGYAPEEQYRTHGVQGPWTDIYALCATMYKCITGITPVESLQRMQGDTLQRPSQLGIPIPPWVEYALMKGMAVFQRDRYQSIAEFCDDLYGDGSNINYDAVASPNQTVYDQMCMQMLPIIKMVTVRVVIQIIVRTTVKTIAKIIVRIIARMDIIKVHIIQMRITAKTTEHKTTINQIMRLLVF